MNSIKKPGGVFTFRFFIEYVNQADISIYYLANLGAWKRRPRFKPKFQFLAG